MNEDYPFLPQTVYRQIFSRPADVELINEARRTYGDPAVAVAVRNGLSERIRDVEDHRKPSLETFVGGAASRLMPPPEIASDPTATLDRIPTIIDNLISQPIDEQRIWEIIPSLHQLGYRFKQPKQHVSKPLTLRISGAVNTVRSLITRR